MYDRTRDQGFGAEVKRRIMLGTYVLSAGYYDAYYLKAQQVRTLIRRDFDEAFASVDVVAMPTTPTAAFRLGENTADPLQMYLADIFTVSAPLAGLPALSVPCGSTASGCPIGLQLTGRAWDEADDSARGTGCGTVVRKRRRAGANAPALRRPTNRRPLPDLNLPRPALLAPREGNREHAVLVVGADARRVDRRRHREAPAERSLSALDAMVGLCLPPRA